MIKRSNIRRQTVALSPAPRPSRIRRDPPGRVPEKKPTAYPAERELWTVVIGVILFGIAIAIITIGFSEITSH